MSKIKAIWKYLCTIPVLGPLLLAVYEVLSPLWDMRVILLLWIMYAVCRAIDPRLAETTAEYMLPVLCIWGVALVLRNVLRPGITSHELVNMAYANPLGAAIVYAVQTIMFVALAYSFIFWWKG